MPHPPRHLDDITAVHPSPSGSPRHYRIDPPERTPPTPALPLWADLIAELLRAVCYTAGAVLGLAIALTALDYVTHWW